MEQNLTIRSQYLHWYEHSLRRYVPLDELELAYLKSMLLQWFNNGGEPNCDLFPVISSSYNAKKVPRNIRESPIYKKILRKLLLEK